MFLIILLKEEFYRLVDFFFVSLYGQCSGFKYLIKIQQVLKYYIQILAVKLRNTQELIYCQQFKNHKGFRYLIKNIQLFHSESILYKVNLVLKKFHHSFLKNFWTDRNIKLKFIA